MVARGSKAGLFLAVVCLVLPGAAHAAEQPGKRIGVVSVSRVFKEYAKVQDVQDNMTRKYENEKKRLETEGEALEVRKNRLELDQRPKTDKNFFLEVKKLEEDKFDWDSQYAAFVKKIEDERTKEMKSVLNDIRAAIRAIGNQERLELVLRAPEFEDDFSLGQPAEDRDDPRSAAELVRKFRENPVLYYAQEIDLTRQVIEKLNTDYKGR